MQLYRKWDWIADDLYEPMNIERGGIDMTDVWSSLVVTLPEQGILVSAGETEINSDNGVDVRQIIAEGEAAENSSLAPAVVTINNILGGTYGVVLRIGIYGIIFAVIAAGGFLAWSNSGNRSEAKGRLIAVICGGLIIFAAVSATALIQKIGVNMFG